MTRAQHQPGVDVRIRRYNLIQKIQWVETVDLGFSAWYQTQMEEIGNGDWLLLTPLWQQGHGRIPRVCKGVDRRTLVTYEHKL